MNPPTSVPVVIGDVLADGAARVRKAVREADDVELSSRRAVSTAARGQTTTLARTRRSLPVALSM